MSGVRPLGGCRAIKVALAVSLVCATSTGTAVGAAQEGPSVHLNAADQHVARSVVLRRTDLSPPRDKWSGGPRVPSSPLAPNCPGYSPKQSDLVLTGTAEADFRTSGVEYDSQVQVLETAAMVSRDWRRSVLAPAAVACQRSQLAKALGTESAITLFRRASGPRIAPDTARFEIAVTLRNASGEVAHVRGEVMLLGRGRTEVTLVGMWLGASQEVVNHAMDRLGRLIALRMPS